MYVQYVTISGGTFNNIVTEGYMVCHWCELAMNDEFYGQWWLEDFDFEKDYNVDETRAESFYAEIRRYYPNLKDNSLVADYSGIRPKISGPGMAAEDFRISAIEDHGVKGHVHLYGIESPGLTSSLALAEMISDIDRIGGGLYT